MTHSRVDANQPEYRGVEIMPGVMAHITDNARAETVAALVRMFEIVKRNYTKMNIVNLTPHTIHLPNISIEPSGKVARCREFTGSAGVVNGVDLIYRKYGDVEDLPDPDPEIFYIVSMLVRQALPNRHDLGSPGDLVRDETGNIVGARNLVVNE
jgi:hypothetical protein